jgi:hypothetical protein
MPTSNKVIIEFQCPYCGWINDTVHVEDHHENGEWGPADEELTERWRYSTDGGKSWTEVEEDPYWSVYTNHS